jgi:hypothetical protein
MRLCWPAEIAQRLQQAPALERGDSLDGRGLDNVDQRLSDMA